ILEAFDVDGVIPSCREEPMQVVKLPLQAVFTFTVFWQVHIVIRVLNYVDVEVCIGHGRWLPSHPVLGRGTISSGRERRFARGPPTMGWRTHGVLIEELWENEFLPKVFRSRSGVRRARGLRPRCRHLLAF